MNEEIQEEKIPVVIMAGGLGKRARSINDSVPKPLLPIAGKPILEWEIDCLVRQGYYNIILTVSYMAEKIIEYFGDGSKFGCKIQYFEEPNPLGNAGALFKMWSANIINGDFLLLNADSMFDIEFDRLVEKHISSGAVATLLTHPNNHPQDSGLIVTDSAGWVEQWLTKEDIRPLYYKNCINAGIHVLNTKILEMACETCVDISRIGKIDSDTNKIVKVDLDRQVLKPLAGKRCVYAVSSPEYVKDMGTPERFNQVEDDLKRGLVLSRNLSHKQKAIFLDRDGTINKYVGFLRDINEFELLPGVPDAISEINKMGYLCIVVTNQPVIARGEVTVEELDMIHKKMETLLGVQGAYIDAVYYCPHHPDKGFAGEIPALKIVCECRKPKPGMLINAAKDFNIDLSKSWMIGDGENDIKAGLSAGCRTIRLNNDMLTAPGLIDELEEYVAKDLKSAVDYIKKNDEVEYAEN